MGPEIIHNSVGPSELSRGALSARLSCLCARPAPKGGQKWPQVLSKSRQLWPSLAKVSPTLSESLTARGARHLVQLGSLLLTITHYYSALLSITHCLSVCLSGAKFDQI